MRVLKRKKECRNQWFNEPENIEKENNYRIYKKK